MSTRSRVFHQTGAAWPGRGGRVDSLSLLMEKSTQCEFCSLADFGSKSAENKAVSVPALSADFGFVLRF